MRLSLAARAARLLTAAGVAVAVLAPAAAPAIAADKLVLRVGTVQSLSSMNPWNANLEVDYEVFQLNYDLLVGFGNDLKPVPGFAESWSQSADGLTWTFKIRPGMKWSDGQPATSADAAFTIDQALVANKTGGSIGLGYTSAYFIDAGIESVSAPDPETLIITTKYPTQRVLSMDAPILPKHIWGKLNPQAAGSFANPLPVVGTGPYQAVEWKNGQYVRFVRNPNYWGTQGAADEVVMRFFPDSQDTMVAAFKKNELDYIRNPSAQQFDQLKTLPGVVAIDAPSAGFEELGFNTYDKPVPGGGASTKALQDPAFRDALGYAIDKQAILDKVYHGRGTLGTTHVPPYYIDVHVEPTTPRTFNVELAKQKLTDAGYVLDASGARLDKEGKPLKLRLYYPTYDPSYATDAQFIADWFAPLGIKVKPQGFDSDTLTSIETAPTADPPGKADYDMFIWGWLGDNGDPNTLLKIFLTSSIASQGSDSLYSNPRYDELFKEQNEAPSADGRKAPIAEMQQLIYTQAPYHILANDSELHVYRTDKFANWQQMPVGTGTPFFVMGTRNYSALTDAKAPPSVAPSTAPTSAASAAPSATDSTAVIATPAPSAATAAATGSSGGSPLLPLGIVALIGVLVVAFVIWRRGKAGQKDAEEE